MNTASLDEAVRTLKAHKDRWARLAIPQKQEYLRLMLRFQAAVAERQVAAAVRAKSIPPGPLTGEERAGGIYPVVSYLDLMLGSLEEVSREGRPRISPSALRVRRDGQLVVTVSPASGSDKMLYRNFRGEVRMADGVTPEDLGGPSVPRGEHCYATDQQLWLQLSRGQGTDFAE